MRGAVVSDSRRVTRDETVRVLGVSPQCSGLYPREMEDMGEF